MMTSVMREDTGVPVSFEWVQPHSVQVAAPVNGSVSFIHFHEVASQTHLADWSSGLNVFPAVYVFSHFLNITAWVGD